MSLSCSEDDHKIKPKEPPCLYCVQFLYLREGSFINNTCGLIRNKENVNVETFLWKLLSTSHQDPVSGQACNPLDFHWSLILLFCGEDLVPVTTQPLNTTSGTNLLHLEGLNPSDRHKTSDRQTDTSLKDQAVKGNRNRLMSDQDHAEDLKSRLCTKSEPFCTVITVRFLVMTQSFWLLEKKKKRLRW